MLKLDKGHVLDMLCGLRKGVLGLDAGCSERWDSWLIHEFGLERRGEGGQFVKMEKTRREESE